MMSVFGWKRSSPSLLRLQLLLSLTIQLFSMVLTSLATATGSLSPIPLTDLSNSITAPGPENSTASNALGENFVDFERGLTFEPLVDGDSGILSREKRHLFWHKQWSWSPQPWSRSRSRPRHKYNHRSSGRNKAARRRPNFDPVRNYRNHQAKKSKSHHNLIYYPNSLWGRRRQFAQAAHAHGGRKFYHDRRPNWEDYNGYAAVLG